MKNPVIFVLSTESNIRGPQQLAPYKAGFFYVSANSGMSVLISSGPSLPSPRKGNCPANVELLTAVFGGSLFLSAYKRQQFHHATSRNHPAQHAQQHPAHKTATRRSYHLQDRATPLEHPQSNRTAQQGSVVASAAIPPAAFLHNYFHSSACPVAG